MKLQITLGRTNYANGFTARRVDRRARGPCADVGRRRETGIEISLPTGHYFMAMLK